MLTAWWLRLTTSIWLQQVTAAIPRCTVTVPLFLYLYDVDVAATMTDILSDYTWLFFRPSVCTHLVGNNH